MTPRNTSWSLLAVFVALALVIGACQSTPGTTTPSASATAAGDQADPNGALTIPKSAEPDTIDPQKSSFVGEIDEAAMAFEGLLSFDSKTTQPIAAAAALPTISSDGKTFTYKIAAGQKYSDGQPLTAKNFEYAFIRGCDPTQAGDYAFVLYVVVGCEEWNGMDTKTATPADLATAKGKVGIKATDDSTLVFTLKEPAAYFVSISALWIGWPVRQDMVEKGGEKWTEPATYIGNGPFVLKEWKHNEKFVYERNPNYRKKVQLKTVTKQIISESAVALAAYRNNEIDMVGVGAADLRTVEADPDLKAQLVDLPGAGACTFYYGYNVRRPPFDDVNIRMAFARSFDRNDLVTNVLGGIGKAADGGFITPGIPGYDTADKTQTYDVTAAKALLAKAAPASVAGLTGLKYTFSSSAANKTRAEWAQAQWKQNLGVTVDLDPVASTEYSALFKKGKDSPQLFLLGWCADFPDAQNWHSTVWGTGGISAARTGYSSPKFDELTGQADKEPDAAKRDSLYKQAGLILSQDAPAAWVWYSAGKELRKPWIKGITYNPQDHSFSGFYSIESIFVIKH